MTYTYEFDTHPAPYPSDFWRRAWVQRVVDGDTYYLRVDLGFHDALTIPLRLSGVNAPEVSTVEGRTARDRVRTLLEGQPVLIQTRKDTQSFARWVGAVRFYEAGMWINLATRLLEQGLAVPMAE